jgi:hypothetical protein
VAVRRQTDRLQLQEPVIEAVRRQTDCSFKNQS